MISRLKSYARSVLNVYPRWVTKREYENQRFQRLNERPVEFAFVFRSLARLYPRTVLDVGTGTTALPHLMRNCGFLVTATDNVTDYWPTGMFNRHYYVIDDDITRTRLTERFDFITCISVLEHVEASDDAVANMIALLNPGGHLALSFPYTEAAYVRNVYTLPGSSYGQNAPFITQSYARSNIDGWLARTGATIAEQEYWEYWDGGTWTVGNQILPPRKSSAAEPHQHTCLLLRKPA